MYSLRIDFTDAQRPLDLHTAALHATRDHKHPITHEERSSSRDATPPPFPGILHHPTTSNPRQNIKTTPSSCRGNSSDALAPRRAGMDDLFEVGTRRGRRWGYFPLTQRYAFRSYNSCDTHKRRLHTLQILSTHRCYGPHVGKAAFASKRVGWGGGILPSHISVSPSRTSAGAWI